VEVAKSKTEMGGDGEIHGVKEGGNAGGGKLRREGWGDAVSAKWLGIWCRETVAG
jgi:hypothetical protein